MLNSVCYYTVRTPGMPGIAPLHMRHTRDPTTPRNLGSISPVFVGKGSQ